MCKIMFVDEYKIVNYAGGIERVICNFANEFIERGYDISIVCLDLEKGKPLFKLNSKVNFTNLAYFGEKYNSIKYYLVKVEKEILKLIKGKKFVNDGGIYNDPRKRYFYSEFIKRLSIVINDLKPDIIICAPGGICMGGFKVWWHVYLLLLSKYFKKPLVYYSRSFGPFDTKSFSDLIFKAYSVNMIRSFDFLSIRDAKSMEIAKSLGVNYIPSIDTAFLETPYVNLPKQIIDVIGKGKYCVFVPNSLTWHYKYKSLSQTVVDDMYLCIMNIIRRKYPEFKIILLPQLCDRPLSADYPYFCKLRDLCGLENVFVLEDVFGSDIQQTIICGSEFVIGARYHSIVFSINNGINFISLNYEHKMNGLLEILNLSEYGINIDDFCLSQSGCENLRNRMKEILSRFDNKKVQEAKVRAKTIANECMKELLNRIALW